MGMEDRTRKDLKHLATPLPLDAEGLRRHLVKAVTTLLVEDHSVALPSVLGTSTGHPRLKMITVNSLRCGMM